VPAGIREVQIIICLMAILPWAYFACKHRQYWGYSVAPILFLLHVVIFNIARIHDFPGDHICANTWSAAIRIQGAISFVILGLGIYVDLKNNGYNGYAEHNA
jgi:hypothetical protein